VQLDVVVPTAALREEAERLLRALAGPDAVLREDQWTAIEALVLGRRRALVVQRTGWGKSAVYFIATALLRQSGAGATVIISPLLSLMRNQLAAAARAGIVARTINSSNIDEWGDVQTAVHEGSVDILLVSPERLNNVGFRRDVLPRLASETGLLVIDEAHCISDWGHDFRPDYRRIATLLTDLPPGIPVLATTATANSRVTADVAEQLGTADPDGAALVLRGSLDRESLRLGVVSLPSFAHRLAWIGEQLGNLPGSGIIYTLTVAQTEQVADALRALGHDVVAYSGQSDPADREAAEQDLLANRIKALVATSALGMGFDKPDLGFVVHLGAPQSPIAYYQQVGRAGRGIDRAEVVLLPGREDEDIWRYFASVGFPPEAVVRQTLDTLTRSGRPMSVPALEVAIELSRSRLEQMLKVLDVEGAVDRVDGGWVATGAGWDYDAERYTRIAAARAAEQQAMRDYVSTRDCRLEFLRRQLDDPAAAPCGRCDNCEGAPLSAAVPEVSLVAVRSRIEAAGVELPPHTRWPSGLGTIDDTIKGAIDPADRVLTGRVLGRMTDISWGPRLRELLRESAPDQQVPSDLMRAATQVLHDWPWDTRPSVVMAVPSRRRPILIDSVAQQLAALGRLEYLGSLEQRTDLGRVGRSNSAHRVRALHDAFTVSEPQRQRLRDLAAPTVLLIDDEVDTGWTMTLAGRALRRGGAGAVLPFALAKTR
jgi:ATP-dependent DNA helicase RecQ